MKRVVYISPHRGVLDFIWGDTRGEKPFKGFAGLVDTRSLDLSGDLFGDFEIWVAEWHGNFVGREEKGGMLLPAWKEGFDSFEWHARGVALMHSLQVERPDLEVRNGFDADVYPSDPVTNEPVPDL